MIFSLRWCILCLSSLLSWSSEIRQSLLQLQITSLFSLLLYSAYTAINDPRIFLRKILSFQPAREEVCFKWLLKSYKHCLKTRKLSDFVHKTGNNEITHFFQIIGYRYFVKEVFDSFFYVRLYFKFPTYGLFLKLIPYSLGKFSKVVLISNYDNMTITMLYKIVDKA